MPPNHDPGPAPTGRWRDAFSLDPERVWLNASHQGPLPDVAAREVARMVEWKQRPHHLSTPAPFTEIPERLRSALAAVVGASTGQVALANSSSYGIHLVANGLGLRAGDEVIVAANDFPSDILPWTRLRDRGVIVHQLRPRTGPVLTAPEVEQAVTSRTRAVCLTWVHSLSGGVVDLDAIGAVCRAADALFVVNGSQGVGAIPIDVMRRPIDVLTSVGFKYLCGPYGTGFVWLGERAMGRVEPTKLYWLSALTADDLARPELDLDSIAVAPTAARHDVFGTANFFNFAPLAASAELIVSIGIDRIHRHALALADRLVDAVDTRHYEVGLGRSDRARAERSAITFLRPRHSDSADVFAGLRAAGIDVAHRAGHLRIAPHLYNTASDIDAAADALAAAATPTTG